MLSRWYPSMDTEAEAIQSSPRFFPVSRIRRASSHRMQAPRLSCAFHRQPVGGKHPLPEVVPRELLQHPFTSGRTILPNQIRTIVQKLNSGRKSVNAAGREAYSVHLVDHDAAVFTRCDL